ncbi:MAG: translesion error-prone DNA polymerase V autoproteolytic subunit [Desulfobacterales bacterium]|nr:translesion error-prone DNA polymerase V autoproteolytic subunit [Desulfobacterales bacterium]
MNNTTIESISHPDQTTESKRPLFFVPVSAGFPSPADDYIESCLDLNKHLVKHPTATFFVRAKGDSMIEAGIHSGDILIVDRSLDATDKKVVIAVIDGELTVKRIRMMGEKIYLLPENSDFSPTEITESMDFTIWGVVTNVIHAL